VGTYKEIAGDLIQLTKAANFDIIVHGCNCFCTMGAGIAKGLKIEWPQIYDADCQTKKGDIKKLGTYTSVDIPILKKSDFWEENKWISCKVINAYTQYNYGREKIQLDYEALTLILRKLNHEFPGKIIGLPKIGCNLAGGDWNIVKPLIQKELKDMNVTIVIK
jgi:O-acetyl-ADP-ribose deacetylase (regulator of RNase III)